MSLKLTKSFTSPEKIAIRFRWHFWGHLTLGFILFIGGLCVGENGEDFIGSSLLSLLSLSVAKLLFSQQGRPRILVWNPDYRVGDSAVEWNQALDKSGSLLTLWVIFLGALSISPIFPGSFSIPDSVNAPLTGLLTVGGLFFVLNDLRPALHKASKDRNRGNPWLWSAGGLFLIVGALLISA